MPLKLPAPDDGTDEQAGPNGAEVVPALLPIAPEDAPAEAFGVAVDAAGELEPQAAPPSASPAAIAVAPRNLNLMIFLLLYRWTAADTAGEWAR
jgi:hypothetical protein